MRCMTSFSKSLPRNLWQGPGDRKRFNRCSFMDNGFSLFQTTLYEPFYDLWSTNSDRARIILNQSITFRTVSLVKSLTLFKLGGGGGGVWRHPELNPLLFANDCVYSVPISWLFLKFTWEQFGVVRFSKLIHLLPWQPNSGALLRSYLLHLCFHFNL